MGGPENAMNSEGEWLKFVDGSFKKEYWIHTTLETGWIREKLPSGKWKYSGSARLVGAKGKSRRVCVMIEGKTHLRHRLIALAKDGTADGLAKFRDGKNNPVEHGKRRREDERPDDRLENVNFGTHATNRNDPNRKKENVYASGHPVILTNATTGETKPFESASAAAAFLDANGGSLRRYLNRKEGSHLSMPKFTLDGAWDAALDEFELTDAVRLIHAAAKLYLSRGRPNQLFRKLETGKFCTTELERNEGGYVQVRVADGGLEYLHRLVVETLRPGAFDAKLAANPGLIREDLEVDHVDGDERNNAIDNLEVLTAREHARKHALAIEWIDASGKVLETFECAADVVEAVRGTNGKPLDKSAVHRVCDVVITHTGGRVFRWKDETDVKAKRAAKLAKRS